MRAPLRRPGGVRGRLEAMASTSTNSSESSTATSSQSTATRESSSTTNSDKVSSFLDRLKFLNLPAKSKANDKLQPSAKGKATCSGNSVERS